MNKIPLNKKMLKSLTFLTVTAIFSIAAQAEIFDVHQKNKVFDVPKATTSGANPTLKVKKGDSVRFHNDDDFFHNVFSLSDVSLFDLGSYPKGSYRDIKFDVTGTVEVECAIHPNMLMTIEVE